MAGYVIKVARLEKNDTGNYRRIRIPEGISFSSLAWIVKVAFGYDSDSMYYYTFGKDKKRIVMKESDPFEDVPYYCETTCVDTFLEEFGGFSFFYGLVLRHCYEITLLEKDPGYAGRRAALIAYKGKNVIEDRFGYQGPMEKDLDVREIKEAFKQSLPMIAPTHIMRDAKDVYAEYGDAYATLRKQRRDANTLKYPGESVKKQLQAFRKKIYGRFQGKKEIGPSTLVDNLKLFDEQDIGFFARMLSLEPDPVVIAEKIKGQPWLFVSAMGLPGARELGKAFALPDGTISKLPPKPHATIWIALGLAHYEMVKGIGGRLTFAKDIDGFVTDVQDEALERFAAEMEMYAEEFGVVECEILRKHWNMTQKCQLDKDTFMAALGVHAPFGHICFHVYDGVTYACFTDVDADEVYRLQKETGVGWADLTLEAQAFANQTYYDRHEGYKALKLIAHKKRLPHAKLLSFLGNIRESLMMRQAWDVPAQKIREVFQGAEKQEWLDIWMAFVDIATSVPLWWLRGQTIRQVDTALWNSLVQDIRDDLFGLPAIVQVELHDAIAKGCLEDGLAKKLKQYPIVLGMVKERIDALAG